MKHAPPSRAPGYLVSWLLAGSLFLGACGSSDATPPDDGVGPSNDGPLYVLSARITTGSELASFALIVDSLEEGTAVDFGTSIEIANGGIVVGPPGQGVMYAVDGATPELTEFRLQPDGSFAMGETLSFLNFSVTTERVARGNFIFLSDTKVYSIDTFAQLIIIWDPSVMAITGTIDLSEIGIPGEVALVGDGEVIRDGEVVIAIDYLGLGQNGQTGFASESVLLFLDPNTDTITRVLTIENCGSVGSLFLDDRGDIYGASSFAGITTRVVGDRGGPECVFRIPRGTYDVVDQALLSERTGDLIAGSMFRSRDTLAYFRVLDLSLLPSDTATAGEVSAARAWTWGLLDLAQNEPIRLVPELGVNGAVVFGFEIDGETWVAESEEGFTGATLVNVSGQSARRGVFVNALIRNAFRLR
ncbi:MAG: hypothetical protein AAF500_15605 [Myxococcota bacterium]